MNLVSSDAKACNNVPLVDFFKDIREIFILLFDAFVVNNN